MIDAKPATELAAEPAIERPGLPVLPPATALLEILVLIVLPAALDYFWTGFPSLSETQPHFFWLPVLLLSLQYGTVSGLLAAGIAITLSALLGWPDQEVGENHFNYLLRIWTQPVLWLTAALVLGQFRMRQIEQKQELARQVAALSSQRTAISDYATNLRARCEALEREIAGRRDPNVRVFLTSLSRLKAGGPDTAAAFSDCLTLAIGRCASSVYVRDADRFRLIASHGTSLNRRDTLPADDPLYRLVAGEGRSLTVLTPGEEAMFAGDGLVAVPVHNPSDGSVIGMLKLDSADANEVNERTVECLAAISAEIAPLVMAGEFAGYAGRVTVSNQAALAATHRPRLWRQMKWQRAAPREARANSKPKAAG